MCQADRHFLWPVEKKAGQKSEDADGGIWLFTSYVLLLGACEIPAVTELIAIA